LIEQINRSAFISFFTGSYRDDFKNPHQIGSNFIGFASLSLTFIWIFIIFVLSITKTQL